MGKIFFKADGIFFCALLTFMDDFVSLSFRCRGYAEYSMKLVRHFQLKRQKLFAENLIFNEFFFRFTIKKFMIVNAELQNCLVVG